MMKHRRLKISAVLLSALLCLVSLCACTQGTSTAESGTPTTPPATEAPTVAATEAPVLNEAAAKALLTTAIMATNEKAVYRHTTVSTAPAVELTVISAFDGQNRHLFRSFNGLDTDYTFVDNLVYSVYSTIDPQGADEKYVTELTDDQKDNLLMLESEAQLLDLAVLMSSDAYTGLSGETQADGTTLITATDVSDSVKAAMGATESAEVTLKTLVLTVSADQLITRLEIAYTLNIPETDFTAAMSFDMTVTRDSIYDEVSVTLPEDVSQYAEEPYAALFEGSVPTNALQQLAGMPLDGDGYMFGEDTSEAAEARGILLTTFPQLYEGKTFTVISEIISTDVSCHVELGQATVKLVMPAELFYPMQGDVASFTATFKLKSGGDAADPDSYIFYITNYEMIERVPGPNGGTYMYVDVNSSLNVRTVPSTANNTPIHSYTRGDVVEVLEIVDGWAKIVFENTDTGYAYVSADYLTAY